MPGKYYPKHRGPWGTCQENAGPRAPHLIDKSKRLLAQRHASACPISCPASPSSFPSSRRRLRNAALAKFVNCHRIIIMYFRHNGYRLHTTRSVAEGSGRAASCRKLTSGESTCLLSLSFSHNCMFITPESHFRTCLSVTISVFAAADDACASPYRCHGV